MSEPEKFLDGRVTLFCGDSRDALDHIPAGSIDACVCDPPYALVSIGKRFGKAGAAPASGNDAYARASAGFMGQSWDTGEVAFSAAFWGKVFRALKPGGHVIAFGGTRAYHRLAVAIEDAGFEIRDSIAEAISLDPAVRAFVDTLSEAQLDAFLRIADLIGFEGVLAWVYGTGFPKSHNVSKAIDRHNGDARPVIGRERLSNDIRGGALLDAAHDGLRPAFERDITSAASAASAAWDGWGTALKPAWEPIVLARKPLAGTVAENVLAHGTGALNIDGCRVGESKRVPGSLSKTENRVFGAGLGGHAQDGSEPGHNPSIGRHPANVILDGSVEVVAAFPVTASGSGAVKQASATGYQGNALGRESRPAGSEMVAYGDEGSAARFFYSAKADGDDRLGSAHPTVKPVDLMQWAVRLVTAKGGTVLDPFAGTGTTGEAAWREGCNAVLIEREPAFQNDIRRRMGLCLAGPDERRRESAKAKAARNPIDLGPLFAAGSDQPEAAE